MSTYVRLARYSLRQWRGLAIVVAGTVGFVATAVLQPLPLKLLIDNAFGGEAVSSGLATLLGWFGAEPTPATLVVFAGVATLLIVTLNALLNVLIQWGWTVAGQRMVYDLAGDVFSKLQRLSLLFHGRRDVGDSLSRLTGDTYGLYTLTDALFVTPVQHGLTFLVVGWAAWVLDPQLALVMLAVAPVLAVVSRFSGKRIKGRALWNRQARAKVLAFVHQSLTSVPLVQVYRSEARNVETLQGLSDDVVAASKASVIASTGFTQAAGTISVIGVSVVTYLGARRVLDGSLTLGALLALLAYVRVLQSSAQNLLTTYATLKTAMASIDRVVEILDEPNDVRDRPDAVALIGKARGDVRFEAVTFGYETGQPAIEDVWLYAAPGELVALVGPTGAGKSTIASLIPRFFDPWSGRVLLDRHDIREFTIGSLRSQVSVVLQDPFLLPLSVADNIAYGRPGVSRDEVELVARAAQAHDFIMQLPDGYDTVLAEWGATLSGGERQRIAIARALVRDAPVLVLDEPTAALDAVTEQALSDALVEVTRDRTTIVIAHRLSTVQRADRIAVVDAGRVVEVGTHRELLAGSGRYARFHALVGGANVPEPVQ